MSSRPAFRPRANNPYAAANNPPPATNGTTNGASSNPYAATHETTASPVNPYASGGYGSAAGGDDDYDPFNSNSYGTTNPYMSDYTSRSTVNVTSPTGGSRSNVHLASPSAATSRSNVNVVPPPAATSRSNLNVASPPPPPPPVVPTPAVSSTASLRQDTGRRERRAGRTGGYGGFGYEAEEEQRQPEPVTYERPPSNDRIAPPKRRSSPRSGSGFVSRNERRTPQYGRSTGGITGTGFGSGPAGGQMEDVLHYIQRDWDFMVNDGCVPVQVALQLMDSSSLGLAHRLREFENTHQQLQNSLKAIVNEHHQGFNSSIGTFHNIQASISASQSKLRTLKDGLMNAKGNLSTTKPELKEMAVSSQNYDDMLQVLASIETLQGIPEQLEARITEKRFLSAVELLQDAMRLIRRSEMDKIDALSDLRVYLSNQEHSLTDILIEELHSHLYLKSPYCENRWKQYAPGALGAESADPNGTASLARGRKLYPFLEKLDLSQPIVDDATRNPEADTFAYIQLLLEALNNLNKLDEAVEAIEHRLPVELYRVVEKSNLDVDSRHPNILRTAPTKNKYDVQGPNNPRTVVLNDLLNTLFARFEAIAEGHRVVHDVLMGLLKREGFKESTHLLRNFREMWKLYQSEIRSVLHDYLATDASSFRSGQDGHNKNIFKKAQRDKTKAMFKLTDMDAKSSDLTMEKEDLEKILKASVPGLVSETKRNEDTLLTTDTTSRSREAGGTGHKLLIEASVFNMGTLLPASLVFLNRLKEVVPPASDVASTSLTMFLDEFLVNVFLPQLDETLVELCAQTFLEADAFQEEPQWANVAQKPICQGTRKFFELVTAFCSMLDNLPHDQAFSQLIVTQMVTYHNTCLRYFDALVVRSQPKADGRVVKSSATFARLSELKTLMTELRGEGGSDLETINKEISVLLEKQGDQKLEEADLILQEKSITALCLVYTSMKWLANKLSHLRHITTETMDSSTHKRHSGRPQPRRQWTAVVSSNLKEEQASIFLPLSKDTVAAFDDAVNKYGELADLSLETLHLEMRCRAMLHLQKAQTQNYRLETVGNEPDAEIIDLNTDLAAFEEELSTVLPVKQQKFITTGITPLLDTLLIRLSAHIPILTNPGCARIQLNILVLQQNLKNIEPDAQLARSALYYDLFSAGPEAVIAKARDEGRECGFTYEEMRRLLELCWSQDVDIEEQGGAGGKAKRGLDEGLLELSEYLY